MQCQYIRCLGDIPSATSINPNVLTLFSGGLDSSFLLQKLRAMGCNVTALAVDVGDIGNVEELERIATALGAKFEYVDAKEQFIQDGVLPAIRAQARYLGHFPISSSLSRPIMAQAAVQAARDNHCGTILHTANTSQNSLRRLNGAIRSLGFTGHFGSPFEWDAISRSEKTQALSGTTREHFAQRLRSGDSNLWCREFESGDLDNPEAFVLPESAYTWSAAPSLSAPSTLSIGFVAGVPRSIDGYALSPQVLISQLNVRLGAYGIGRFEGLEHLAGDEKVLEVREAPAAHALLEAYHHLSTATLGYELLREKRHQEQIWVREAVEGRWFGTLKTACQAFIDALSQSVSGEVRFQLRPGALSLAGVRADNPMYLTDRDQWEAQQSQSLAWRRPPAPLSIVAAPTAEIA